MIKQLIVNPYRLKITVDGGGKTFTMNDSVNSFMIETDFGFLTVMKSKTDGRYHIVYISIDEYIKTLKGETDGKANVIFTFDDEGNLINYFEFVVFLVRSGINNITPQSVEKIITNTTNMSPENFRESYLLFKEKIEAGDYQATRNFRFIKSIVDFVNGERKLSPDWSGPTGWRIKDYKSRIQDAIETENLGKNP